MGKEFKIEDGELKNAISNELSSNPVFKSEFDSFNTALKSINSFTFAEPPDNYFNNLLPQINEKIYSETSAFSFKKSFPAIWKFVLPVTAVILMFIGYETFFNNNEYINNIKSDSQVVLKNNNSGKSENDDKIYNDMDANVNKEPVEQENNDNFITGMTKSFYSRQTNTDKNKISDAEENNNIAIDISENTSDDDVFFSNEEEPNIEQEFEKLNSDEQNKILAEIKNSKF
jgi:hypothetical protein